MSSSPRPSDSLEAEDGPALPPARKESAPALPPMAGRCQGCDRPGQPVGWPPLPATAEYCYGCVKQLASQFPKMRTPCQRCGHVWNPAAPSDPSLCVACYSGFLVGGLAGELDLPPGSADHLHREYLRGAQLNLEWVGYVVELVIEEMEPGAQPPFSPTLVSPPAAPRALSAGGKSDAISTWRRRLSNSAQTSGTAETKR